jgi:Ca2+-binding RTX toxin-like protein
MPSPGLLIRRSAYSRQASFRYPARGESGDRRCSHQASLEVPMATFVAQQAIDFGPDSIFGLFTRSTRQDYDSAFSFVKDTGFTFTGEGDINADVTGGDFIIISGVGSGGVGFEYPALGKLHSIQAFHGNDIWFTVTEFSAAFAADITGHMIGDHKADLFARLTAGDDKLTGSPYADNLGGFGGNDLVLGGGGDDDLSGGVGDDTLDGQRGNDRLNGELHGDHFVFSTAIHAGNNVDTIVGFVRGEDIIELDNAVFAKLKSEGQLEEDYFEVGKKADDSNDFIVFNKKTDSLFYDKNGDKKGGASKFAVLEGGPDDISSEDFLVV